MKVGFVIAALLLIGVAFVATPVIAQVTKRVEVQSTCGGRHGEEWLGCAIDVALEKRDASYYWAGGLFGPYTGLCMDEFARQTSTRESCDTISKPNPREACSSRF